MKMPLLAVAALAATLSGAAVFANDADVNADLSTPPADVSGSANAETDPGSVTEGVVVPDSQEDMSGVSGDAMSGSGQVQSE